MPGERQLDASERFDLPGDGVAAACEHDEEPSAFLWIPFNGDEIKALVALAVDGTEGLNSAADGTA